MAQFKDMDGDILTVERISGSVMIGASVGEDEATLVYRASDIPALCRALHEAAGIPWPAAQPRAAEPASKDPATPAEDRDFVPGLARSSSIFPHFKVDIPMPSVPPPREPTLDLSDLKAALEGSMVALDDMMQRFAAELCEPERVRVAIDRIRANGGTLAYITAVQERNRKAMSGERAGLLTDERPADPVGLAVHALESAADTLVLNNSSQTHRQAALDEVNRALAALRGRRGE